MEDIVKQNNEFKHYGVLGMKWGVRKNGQTSSIAPTSKPKKKSPWVLTDGPRQKTKREQEYEDQHGISPAGEIRKTRDRLDPLKRLEKNTPNMKDVASKAAKKAIERVKKKITKEKAAKAAAKGAEVAAKLATASVVDDVFYGGVGKKIAKETVKQTGRAVVTAYTMARGGYDIHWYDK